MQKPFSSSPLNLFVYSQCDIVNDYTTHHIDIIELHLRRALSWSGTTIVADMRDNNEAARARSLLVPSM